MQAIQSSMIRKKKDTEGNNTRKHNSQINVFSFLRRVFKTHKHFFLTFLSNFIVITIYSHFIPWVFTCAWCNILLFISLLLLLFWFFFWSDVCQAPLNTLKDKISLIPFYIILEIMWCNLYIFCKIPCKIRCIELKANVRRFKAFISKRVTSYLQY